MPFIVFLLGQVAKATALLGYDAPTKNIGEYSGVISDESTGEMTPFQTYDTITP